MVRSGIFMGPSDRIASCIGHAHTSIEMRHPINGKTWPGIAYVAAWFAIGSISAFMGNFLGMTILFGYGAMMLFIVRKHTSKFTIK